MHLPKEETYTSIKFYTVLVRSPELVFIGVTRIYTSSVTEDRSRDRERANRCSLRLCLGLFHTIRFASLSLNHACVYRNSIKSFQTIVTLIFIYSRSIRPHVYTVNKTRVTTMPIMIIYFGRILKVMMILGDDRDDIFQLKHFQ